MSLIGRESERSLVDAFLDHPYPGARILVLQGEAGIGKTTIWQAAIEAASQRGYRVTITRPTAAEARLPFAGLNDLFGELVDDTPLELPPPQRTALDVALLRAGVAEGPMQPLALSLAVLELLRNAASGQPIALAIDDVQWLDESSSGVLRFALRRLERESVVVLATQRTGDGAPDAAMLADLPSGRLTRITVSGLGIEAIDRLVDEALGLQLTPTVLRRVHATSGGNPFYAVEIGRALQARGVDRLTGEVPLPESLSALLRERLTALPPDAREVVSHAAALSQPSGPALEAALGTEWARLGLMAAREAAVLAPGDDQIRFSHPLLAAEAYAALSPEARSAVHRRLATVVVEPEELARHLALAASGPDPAVAVALDAAAVHAHGRNAPDAAAQLSEQAALLTEATDPQRARRMAAAGRYLLVAGDLGRARGLLERALAEPAAAEGPPRAELLYRLAFVRELMDDFEVSEQLGHDALQHAGDDRALTVRIKLLLAGTAFVTGRNWSSGANHALEALELAEQLGDREILAAAMGPYLSWRYVTGHAYDPSVLRRVDALEPWMRRLRVLDQAEFDVAGIEFLEGEPAAASRFGRLLERAERDGDYSSLPFLLGIAAFGDLNAGRPDQARERIDRALRLAQTTEQGTALVHVRASQARLEARLGNAEAALAAGREAGELIEATKWRLGMWAMLADLALLELSRDRPAAALEFVGDSVSPSAPDETGRRRSLQVVAADVLVALGRHDEARSLLARLDAKVTRDGSRRLFAEVLRARARLLAATGDLDAAESAIWEAEAIHRRMEDRWEIARTLLVAGEIHRRARRRAKARKALTEALELFELLGARLWAAQTREQLGRIGAGRAEGGLTATQAQVAELVAEGLTNRQVADRLFMSPHTVEAHLTTIYRTLGIGSRLEIGVALARKRTPRDSAADFRDSRSAMPGED